MLISALNNVSTLNTPIEQWCRHPANEPITVHNMVLAVKGLRKLS